MRVKYESGEGFTPHVLLVDDDKDQLFMMAELLKQAGIHVITASDAKSASELISTRPISCVVSDVMMPQLSGIEFCSKIRSAKSFARIPVVLLTAGDNSLEKEGYESGADKFCFKKDAYKELASIVKSIVD